MIILSGVLVVAAIALLIVGIVASYMDSAQVLGLDALTLIYISIAVSIASALCLAIGVFLRRKELFGAGVGVGTSRKPPKKAKAPRGRKASRIASGTETPKDATGEKDGDEAVRLGKDAPLPDDLVIPAQPVDVPDDALVHVVRGRKRYHLDSCRQLAGRDKEDLTYAEALEEGFSPCTACMPDTALAARAAAAGQEAAVATAAKAPATAGTGLGKTDTADATGPGTATPLTGEPTPSKATSSTAPGGVPSARPAPEAPASDEPASAPSDEEPPATVAERDTTEDHGEPDEERSASAADSETTGAPPEESAAEESAVDGESGSSAVPDAAGIEEAVEPEPEAAGPASDDERAEGSVVDPADVPDDQVDVADSDTAEDEPADGEPQVRILGGTKRYHRADCALIEDIGDEADDLEALPRGEAQARGCTPCLVCQPDKEHVRD